MENIIAAMFISLVFVCIWLFIIFEEYHLFNRNTDTTISYEQFIKIFNSKKYLLMSFNHSFIKINENPSYHYIGMSSFLSYLKYQNFVSLYYRELEKRNYNCKKQKTDEFIQSLLNDKAED